MFNRKNKNQPVKDDKIIVQPIEDISLNQKAAKRGFKSYKHAVEYLESESFKKLGIEDRTELEAWIKKLK